MRSPDAPALAEALDRAFGLRLHGPDADGWWTARGIEAAHLARLTLAEGRLVTGLRDHDVDLEARFLQLTEEAA